jgi:hypothetical protein
VDLGSTVDVKRFGGAEELISFSEKLLARAYKGEVKPGAEVEVTLSPKGQKPLKGKMRVLRTGEKIDGVDVGPSDTGGRLVVEVKFDRPIGKEGVVELKDGQKALEVDRNSGGRTEKVKVVEGEKADTDTIYIVGGSYGPTGKFGLYTVFSGRYAPPISDTAYWGKHAFVTGEKSSWKVEGGKVVVGGKSRLAEMIKDGTESAAKPVANGKVLSAEEGFGVSVRRAVGNFFRSALGYFYERNNGMPEAVVDKMAQAGVDVFDGSPAEAASKAVELVGQFSGDPMALAQVKMRIFSSDNAVDIVKRLASEKVAEGKTMLEILVPELEGKRIEQDAKYHKDQNVFDHLVESVKVMDGLIADGAFSPKQKALLRLVALFHDIGKHDDANATHLGRKLVADNGSIRFPGHQESSAKIFEDTVRKRINPNLPEGQRFSDAEIALGRHLVAIHMRAIELVANVKEKKGKYVVSDKALKKYIEELCIKNQQLLQMGISLDIIVKTVLLVGEMDIRAASKYEGKETAIAKFKVIANEMRSRLDELKRTIIRKATDPLVSGEDVKSALGTKKGGPLVGKIMGEILDLQLKGKLISRKGALEKVVNMAEKEGHKVDPDFVKDRLDVMKESKQKFGYELATKKTITDKDGHVVATINFYRMNPVAQFALFDNVKQVKCQIMETGNYPRTKQAIEKGEITADEVYNLIKSGKKGVSNLRQFEELVKSMRQGSTELKNLAATSGVATLPVIEIIRADGTKIMIKGGYQSSVEHNAIGGFHMAAQRLHDLYQAFRKPGETMEDTLSRFMEDVVKVLATSKVEVPSNRSETKSIFFGKINGSEQYVAIVVDKGNTAEVVDKGNTAEWSVITTMFRGSAKEMRSNLVMYALRQLKFRTVNRKPVSDADFTDILKNVNRFLKKEGVKEITIDEVYGLDDPKAPGTGEKQIKAAIEAKGYAGKKINKAFSKVTQNCKTFKEAMEYVKTKLKDASQPKAKAKGGKAKSGPALYAELLDAMGFDKKEKGKHMGKVMGMVKKGVPDPKIREYIEGLPESKAKPAEAGKPKAPKAPEAPKAKPKAEDVDAKVEALKPGEVFADISSSGALLQLKHPKKLRVFEMGGEKWVPKDEFHITLMGFAHNIAGILKSKKGLSAKKAKTQAKKMFEEAAKGIEFSYELTNEYRITDRVNDKTGQKDSTIVQIVKAEGVETFYRRVEAKLKELTGEDIKLSRVPPHITLFVREGTKPIGFSSRPQLEQLTRKKIEGADKEAFEAKAFEIEGSAPKASRPGGVMEVLKDIARKPGAGKVILVGGVLAALGSYFLDPVTSMLTFPLLGMAIGRGAKGGNGKSGPKHDPSLIRFDRSKVDDMGMVDHSDGLVVVDLTPCKNGDGRDVRTAMTPKGAIAVEVQGDSFVEIREPMILVHPREGAKVVDQKGLVWDAISFDKETGYMMVKRGENADAYKLFKLDGKRPVEISWDAVEEHVKMRVYENPDEVWFKHFAQDLDVETDVGRLRMPLNELAREPAEGDAKFREHTVIVEGHKIAVRIQEGVRIQGVDIIEEVGIPLGAIPVVLSRTIKEVVVIDEATAARMSEGKDIAGYYLPGGRIVLIAPRFARQAGATIKEGRERALLTLGGRTIVPHEAAHYYTVDVPPLFRDRLQLAIALAVYKDGRAGWWHYAMKNWKEAFAVGVEGFLWKTDNTMKQVILNALFNPDWR